MNKSRLLLAVLLLMGYGLLNAMGKMSKLAGAAASLRAAQQQSSEAVARSSRFLQRDIDRLVSASEKMDRSLQRDQERHKLRMAIVERPETVDVEVQTDVIPVPAPVHVVQSAAEIEPAMRRRERREQSESDLSAPLSAAAATVDVQHVELQQPESAPAVQVPPVQQTILETQPVRPSHWWSCAQSIANLCFTYIKNTRTVTKVVAVCGILVIMAVAAKKALEHKSAPK